MDSTTTLELPSDVSRVDCSAIDIKLQMVAVAGHLLEDCDRSRVWTFKLAANTETPYDAFVVESDAYMSLGNTSKMVCGNLSFAHQLNGSVKLLYVRPFYQDSCASDVRQPSVARAGPQTEHQRPEQESHTGL